MLSPKQDEEFDLNSREEHLKIEFYKALNNLESQEREEKEEQDRSFRKLIRGTKIKLSRLYEDIEKQAKNEQLSINHYLHQIQRAYQENPITPDGILEPISNIRQNFDSDSPGKENLGYFTKKATPTDRKFNESDKYLKHMIQKDIELREETLKDFANKLHPSRIRFLNTNKPFLSPSNITHRLLTIYKKPVQFITDLFSYEGLMSIDCHYLKIKIKFCNSVMDKLQAGEYIVNVSLYNQLGGNTTQQKLIETYLQQNFRQLADNFDGHFPLSSAYSYPSFHLDTTQSTLMINKVVLLLIPPLVDCTVYSTIIFQLINHQPNLCKGHKCVAWGAFPLLDSSLNFCTGEFRTSMLKGQIDKTVIKFSEIERITKLDPDRWLCNMYFTCSHAKIENITESLSIKPIWLPDKVLDIHTQDEGNQHIPLIQSTYNPSAFSLKSTLKSKYLYNLQKVHENKNETIKLAESIDSKPEIETSNPPLYKLSMTPLTPKLDDSAQVNLLTHIKSPLKSSNKIKLPLIIYDSTPNHSQNETLTHSHTYNQLSIPTESSNIPDVHSKTLSPPLSQSRKPIYSKAILETYSSPPSNLNTPELAIPQLHLHQEVSSSLHSGMASQYTHDISHISPRNSQLMPLYGQKSMRALNNTYLQTTPQIYSTSLNSPKFSSSMNNTAHIVHLSQIRKENISESFKNNLSKIFRSKQSFQTSQEPIIKARLTSDYSSNYRDNEDKGIPLKSPRAICSNFTYSVSKNGSDSEIKIWDYLTPTFTLAFRRLLCKPILLFCLILCALLTNSMAFSLGVWAALLILEVPIFGFSYSFLTVDIIFSKGEINLIKALIITLSGLLSPIFTFFILLYLQKLIEQIQPQKTHFLNHSYLLCLSTTNTIIGWLVAIFQSFTLPNKTFQIFLLLSTYQNNSNMSTFGIISTIILYFLFCFFSVLVLGSYVGKDFYRGVMFDCYKRLNSSEKALYLPDDYLITYDVINNYCHTANSYEDDEGNFHKIQVTYINDSNQGDKEWSMKSQPPDVPNTNKNSKILSNNTFYLTIWTMNYHIKDKREVHRQFYKDEFGNFYIVDPPIETFAILDEYDGAAAYETHFTELALSKANTIQLYISPNSPIKTTYL